MGLGRGAPPLPFFLMRCTQAKSDEPLRGAHGGSRKLPALVAFYIFDVVLCVCDLPAATAGPCDWWIQACNNSKQPAAAAGDHHYSRRRRGGFGSIAFLAAGRGLVAGRTRSIQGPWPQSIDPPDDAVIKWPRSYSAARSIQAAASAVALMVVAEALGGSGWAFFLSHAITITHS